MATLAVETEGLATTVRVEEAKEAEEAVVATVVTVVQISQIVSNT